MQIHGFHLLTLLFVLSFLAVASSHATAGDPSPPYDIGARNNPEIKKVRALLQQPERQMDLVRFKLTIDRMIEPAIDIEANLKRLDLMVGTIRGMLGPNPSSTDKMLAIKKFLYEPGPWNDHRPFQYDFDDPMGTKIANKLLPNYMTTRKGNCVSMPFLFIILGQKLGIDVTASTAPLHVFVKFTDDATGVTSNLETTSGANFSRDVWYRQTMPMTEQAVVSGIYLQRLTRKETTVVMAHTLAEHYVNQDQIENAIALSELLLEYYPKDVTSMLRSGSAYRRVSEQHFANKYRTVDEMPPKDRAFYDYLYKRHHHWFNTAIGLGWHRPDEAEENRYAQMMKDAKAYAR